MFAHLAKHQHILVTGPHRAGTTFAATAIAADTGHLLVLEERCWMPGFRLEKLEHWLTVTPQRVVIQAPFVADNCHAYPHALVVFMMRDLSDIKRSQQRMYNADGKRLHWESIERAERRKYHGAQGNISVIKYRQWDVQKGRLPNHLELMYETLSGHPMWVNKDERKTFHVRQTSPPGEVATTDTRVVEAAPARARGTNSGVG